MSRMPQDPADEFLGPEPPPCERGYPGRVHMHPRFPSGDCTECGALCTEGCKHPLATGEGEWDSDEISQPYARELARQVDELEAENAALLAIVRIFLGEDARFQVAVGGNPIAVDRMLAEARAVVGNRGHEKGPLKT